MRGEQLEHKKDFRKKGGSRVTNGLMKWGQWSFK